MLNRLVVGGQSIDTLPLANALKQDYDILIVHGNKEDDEEAYTQVLNESEGITFKKIDTLKRSINPLNDISSFISLYRTIKKFQPSIVHTHGSKPGVTGRLAAWFAGVPVIIHTFHGHLFHSYYNKFVSFFIIRFERLLGKLSTKIVVLSTRQQVEIGETYKIAPIEKMALIPLGVDDFADMQNALDLRTASRKKYGLQEECVAIGTIGRMVPVKNYKLFADIIIALLPSVKQKVKFFFIGDGDLKIELQQKLTAADIEWSNDNQNLNAQVIFTSWVSPVTDILHGMDIIALTSLNEGTPLSLIEAQICGKPVVASNAGGVRDTFIDNESGFLITGYDVNPYAEKLKLLIENKDLRITMGAKGHTFAKEKFSKQAEVNAFRKLYADSIA